QVKKWTGNIKNIRTFYRNQVEVRVDRNDLVSLAQFLSKNGWPYVTSASGVDYPETKELEMVYFFSNMENRKILIVKTRCPHDDPWIPSLCEVFMSTNFHEREANDLFGIRFPGHVQQLDEQGNLPKLLLPDDWPEFEDDPPFPFRKEYVQMARPFEKVSDTRGFKGERWKKYSRPIDRSGWLDEYYSESSDEKDYSLRKNVAPEVPVPTEEKKEKE
ncbi:MAG: NADH-quinone oxidoreductase subunit C, partial [Candidatus Thorarchaeota archaeon]